MPDSLKTGVENLSGYSMDDVKVHYNSDKPAQLQAHAFAQGTDIHMAPGQEQHLGHEAWHVVQQKQGRVQPTVQMKGEVNVNDDAGLEQEADVMGNLAMNYPMSSQNGDEAIVNSFSNNNLVSNLFIPTVAQRKIDAEAFIRFSASVTAQNMASLTRDVDKVDCVVRRAAVDFEVTAKDAPLVWVAINEAKLRSDYSWKNETVRYSMPKKFEKNPNLRTVTKERGKDQLKQNGPGGEKLTINEFVGDELAMVHHTSGGGSDEHLTIENAHLSALHHIADMGKIDGFNKGGKDKPGHEKLMEGYGSAPTDNLNFFPKKAAKKKEKEQVYDISLADYLKVVRFAMDHITDVPPIYGVEVVRSANAMAATKGLDPTKLFLPKGAGQERQLFKASMNMHKMGLIRVPDPIVTAFTGYAQPKPQLTDPDTQAVSTEGESAFNSLQTKLVDLHLPALIVYLKSL